MSINIGMDELSATYDSRKSFYGKAHTYHEGNRKILRSYSTDVAYIERLEDGTRRLVVKDRYSATTDRHVREFMKQNGFMHLAQAPWKQVMAECGPEADGGLNAEHSPRVDEDELVLFG